MLSSTGLSNQTGFAQALSQKCLSQNVINLVAAGVVQVLPFEEDAGASAVLSKPMSLRNDGRAPGVGAVKFGKFVGESGIGLRGGVRCLEFVQGVDEGLRDETTTKLAVVGT